MTPADMAMVRTLVRERAGIVLGEDKDYLVESRLAPVASAAGLPSLAALAARLRAAPWSDLHREAVDALTTNETFFFRDVSPFEALKAAVLPPLLARRAIQRRLRIWCAACSTGQEPYSVALLLRDAFPQVAGWDVRILATDLNARVLARARAGVYTRQEVDRGLPPTLLTRWFEGRGDQFFLREEIRRMVEFREHNLIEPRWNVEVQDVVFLRNVLIYFDPPTKKAILGRVRQLLARDGSLFLGGAETTLNLDDAFVRVPYDRGCAYRLLREDEAPPRTERSDRFPRIE